jgi:tetratricopeptide (TPR) repeat protein
VPWLVAAAAVADACSRRVEHASVLELCRTLAATELTPEQHHAYAHAVATTMTTLLWHGEPALVEQLFAQLARVEAAGVDAATSAWIYYARAWRALHDGDHAASLLLDQKVEQCFTAVGDLRQACRQQASVGYSQMILGANVAAERSLRNAMSIATRIGLHQVTTQAQHNLGLVLARLGRIDEARDVEFAAMTAFDAHDNRRSSAFARNYLAEIEIAAGKPEVAVRYADEAIQIDADQPSFHCVYRARLASAYLLADDPRPALEEATTAMQLMETHGKPEEGEAVVRLTYARALHANRRTPEALAAIADAEQHVLAGGAKIGDADLRRSFLEAVPEHALTLELARAWRS